MLREGDFAGPRELGDDDFIGSDPVFDDGGEVGRELFAAEVGAEHEPVSASAKQHDQRQSPRIPDQLDQRVAERVWHPHGDARSLSE